MLDGQKNCPASKRLQGERAFNLVWRLGLSVCLSVVVFNIEISECLYDRKL